MTTDRIPVKTAAGQTELERRPRVLTQRQRTMLFLIDGRRSVDEVKQMAARAGATQACFDELMALGLIALAAPSARTSRNSVPGSLSESSFMPSARSLLPDSVQSDSMRAALAWPDAWPHNEPDTVVEEARRILIRAVRGEAPVAGSFTVLRLRRAKGRHELLALLPEVESRISRPLHRLTAAQTLRHVRGLLGRTNP